jgi:hypothetical protein
MHLLTTLSLSVRNTTLLAATFLLLAVTGCKPRVYEFYAESKVVSAADFIRLHWKVKGTPTLLVRETKIQTTGDSVRALEFTLVAEKGGKEDFRREQVEIRSDQTTDILAFDTQLEGDSVLVAKGVKSTSRWSNFEVVSLASASARELRISHESQTAVLDAAGNASSALSGKTYAGTWEIRTPMTAEERADSTRRPNSIRVKAIVQPKK